MKDRIKEIRKALTEKTGIKMTQEQFAKELGLAKNTVTAFEIGRRTPSDSVIKLMCEKYHINETWVITGEGGMFESNSKEQEIAQITAQLFKEEDDSFRTKLISLVSRMSDEQIEMCKEFAKKLCE